MPHIKNTAKLNVKRHHPVGDIPDSSLPGLEPGASGLEVQRAIPLRHRDWATWCNVKRGDILHHNRILQHQDQCTVWAALAMRTARGRPALLSWSACGNGGEPHLASERKMVYVISYEISITSRGYRSIRKSMNIVVTIR